MKLSTRARYALRMMVEMARQKNGDPISLGQVAENTNISRRYLDQLAIGLRNASLIRGRAGKRGGYYLASPARAVTVGAVVEAAIGPINIVECVRLPETCSKAATCECRWLYQLVNQRIIDVLHEISLADLADREAFEHLVDHIDTEGTACAARESLGECNVESKDHDR